MDCIIIAMTSAASFIRKNGLDLLLPGSNKPLFVNLYSGEKLNFKDKSPLAAMTCESTQPTLSATTQCDTFVLAVIQLFAAYNCRIRSKMFK